MRSNGWSFYESVHEGSQHWLLTLDALRAAVDVGRRMSHGWPAREIAEKVSAKRVGDLLEVYETLDAALTTAAKDEDVLMVRWDCSQGGTESPSEPGYMRARSYQLTATRSSGLTLYAGSPIESEVPQMLSPVQQTSKEVLKGPHGAPVRSRWQSFKQVIRHPVVSGLLVVAIAAVVGAVVKAFS